MTISLTDKQSDVLFLILDQYLVNKASSVVSSDDDTVDVVRSIIDQLYDSQPVGG